MEVWLLYKRNETSSTVIMRELLLWGGGGSSVFVESGDTFRLASCKEFVVSFCFRDAMIVVARHFPRKFVCWYRSLPYIVYCEVFHI